MADEDLMAADSQHRALQTSSKAADKRTPSQPVVLCPGPRAPPDELRAHVLSIQHCLNLPGTGMMLARAWARRTSVTRKFMMSAFISSFLSRTLLIFFSHSCLLTDLCRHKHLQ